MSHPILGELADQLTTQQHEMVDAAILENPDGVRRVVRSIGPKAHSPVAVLVANLRKGHHRTEPTKDKQSLLQFAVALHTARSNAYAVTGERGWNSSDAIVYAVDQTVAVHGCNARRLEQQLREHLGLAANSDVASPEVRRRWISVHRRLQTSQEARAELHRLLDLGAPGNAILAKLEAILGPDKTGTPGVLIQPIGTGMLKTIDQALATPPRAPRDDEDDLADLFRKAG